MKKLLAILMCVCMVCSLGATAFATEITQDSAQSTNTTVTYGVKTSYTVTIPESITLDGNGEGDINLTIADILLPTGQYLCGFMKYDETFTDVNNPANTLKYWIGSGEHVNEPGDLCIIGSSGVTSDSYVFTLHCEDVPLFSGTYTDTITFEFELRTLLYFELVGGYIVDGPQGEVCEAGMTFAEWVNSPYNIHRYTLDLLNTSREISADGHEVIATQRYILGVSGGSA